MHAARPPDIERGRRRIVFEEFFGIALAAALKRAQRERGRRTPVNAPGDWYDASRPNSVRADRRAGARDRAARARWRAAPMNRLLQGDVGSGKTLVAAAAIVLATTRGCRAR